MDASPDLERMEAEIAKLNPADAKGFRSFMTDNRVKLEASARCWSGPSTA